MCERESGALRRTRALAAAACCLLSASMAQAQQEEPDETEAGEAGEALTAALEEIAALRERLERLEQEAAERRQRQEEAELAELRREAQELASAPETAEERAADSSSDQTFTSGQRSLQALNPELSLVVDTGVQIQMNDGDPATIFGDGLLVDEGDHDHGHSHGTAEGTGFLFRHLGLHFETNLDPFSFTKIAIGVNTDGVFLGEAYVTWVRIAQGLQLTLGKFLQPFGVVSRWHLPSLDQYDQPLAITEILGGGINQVGLSLDWLIPTSSSRTSHELILQVTTPNNGHLFTGEYFDVPTVLVRLRNYFDLTEDTYLELGLTGMWGTNHQDAQHLESEPVPAYDADGEPLMAYDADGNELGQLMVTPEHRVLDEFWGQVGLAGADLTISWSPLERERYRHVTWRSEFYFARRETREGVIQAMGGYSYVDIGLTEAWAIGVRGDLTQPFELEAEGLRWAATAYMTWWQSPWVRLRLQYTHAQGGHRAMEDRLVLQFVFAAGPHKHDRY